MTETVDGLLQAAGDDLIRHPGGDLAARGIEARIIDVDFMCAWREGFSELRARTFDKGLPALLKADRALREIRELRRDAFGIRSWVDVEGTATKIEIVNEARINRTAQ